MTLNADAVRANCQEWFDADADVYNAKYLDKALPIELCNAHTQDKLVGLLQIELPVELDLKARLTCRRQSRKKTLHN